MSTEGGMVVVTVVHSRVCIRLHIHDISNLEKELGTIACFDIVGWLMLVGDANMLSILDQLHT